MPHFALVTRDGETLAAVEFAGENWSAGNVIYRGGASSTCSRATTRRSSHARHRGDVDSLAADPTVDLLAVGCTVSYMRNPWNVVRCTLNIRHRWQPISVDGHRARDVP
ncbi:MAG TPA: hypothetical protein VKA45_00790 [Gaiellaceae bacterium]|nr:hypothetical protein [Gaiellaceae bacterium]